MKQPKVPKYPFRRVGPADKPTQNDLRSLARSAYASGKGEAKIKPSKQYLDLEKKKAVMEKPAHGIRPPKWLLARMARHAPTRVIVGDLIKRLRRLPSEKNIRFTQCGFNELGRRRGGGKLLRRTITQQLVDEFQAKGEK